MSDKSFEQYPADYRCSVCGCRQDSHRGGSPLDNNHACPPVSSYGYPKAFPRVTYFEGQQKNYIEYWKRIEQYWSVSGTQFTPKA